MSKSILVLLSLLTLSGAASASSVYVSGSGQFSSSDVPGTLVSPNGLFSFQLTVDANPAPIAGSVSLLGFDAPFFGFRYTLNGLTISAIPTEVRFNTAANGGLFDIVFGTGLNAVDFSFQGSQAFSGSTSLPVIALGNYPVTSFTYSDSNNYDTQASRVIASITPTPEPGSLLLLLSGIATLMTVPFLRSLRAR